MPEKFAGNEFSPIFATAKAAPAVLRKGPLAQLVEHDTLNVGVQGSSP